MFNVIKTSEMSGESEMLRVSCNLCHKTFKSLKIMKQHQKGVHKIEKLCDTKPRLSCEICDKSFKTLKTLKQHQEGIHKILNESNSYHNIFCMEGCGESFRTIQMYREHLNDKHKIEVNVPEKLEFDSMNDFYRWLQAEESQSHSHFVMRSGERKTTRAKILYFVCNRSGSYISKSTGKRQLKSQGSQKLGYNCTAGIKVIMQNEQSKIKVVYHKTHYKHEKSLGHLPLSKADKETIAAMLVQGIDSSSILNGIKSTSGEKVERKHITKLKDLYNIRQSLGIPNPRDEYKIYRSNATSIEEWLKKMDRLGARNPILFYKKEGEEHHLLNKDDLFLIVMSPFQRKMLESFGSDRICVDSLKSVKGYHFELVVVMIIDEFQEPFPVSFCFCSSINFSSMKLFFQHIQSAIDSIQTNTFMSNDSPAFYNAWAEVFGPANHRLFSWYVDKAWQDNLQGISDEDKKEMICNMLNTLLYELDKNTFHQTLSQFIEQLKEDSDTLSFYDYFLNYYSNRVPMWAYCYGKEAPIDAEVYADAFHKILKHAFLVGDESKRIDKRINTLLSYVLDLQFDHQSKLPKGKIPFMFSTSFQHRNGNLSSREKSNKDSQCIQPSRWTEICHIFKDNSHDPIQFQKLNNRETLHSRYFGNDNEHSYVQRLGKFSEQLESNKTKLLQQLNVVSEVITSKPEISDSLLTIVSKPLNEIKCLLTT